jgi:hypothetical protein
LELNETHHLHDYADDINVFNEDLNIIKKITEAPLGADEQVGLE